jgi:hypothetical protein
MKMMHIWSTFRLMVANPGRLWKMAAIVTKNGFFYFFWGMGSSTIILKEYYIYVSNLIAIYSKGFFWIFFNGFFCWFYHYVLFINMAAKMVGRKGANWWQSLIQVDYPYWSYCPFFHQIFKILILFILYFKNYKR